MDMYVVHWLDVRVVVGSQGASSVMGETFQECTSAIGKLRRLLIELGFKIHPDKSVFVLTQKITFYDR